MGQQQEEVDAVVISCVRVCVWILDVLACTVCAGAMNTKLYVKISEG